ncbi:MAG: M56 family metallopeptidase [bacterium]
MSSLSPLLFAWAIKAMLLCVLAGGIVALFRGAPAAIRHAIWTAAIGGFLILPLAYFLLPAWRVPLAASATAWLPELSPVPSSGPSVTDVRAEQIPGVQAAPANRAPSLAQRTFPIADILLVLWGTGTLAVLCWLGVGYGELHRMSVHAIEQADPLWRSSLDDAARTLGVTRPVTLRTSPDVSAPCVAGVLHAIVLLPANSEGWSAEQRRSVLLHELAHVGRHDRSIQFVAQLACALLWFSPLHWYVAWRIRIERERACDDLVLSTGISPVAYADVLLETAKGFRFRRSVAATAVAMARYSNLEERLLAVLSEEPHRTAMTTRRGRLLAPAMLFLALPIGALRPGHASVVSPQSLKSVAGTTPSDTVYARVIPKDGATELTLTAREIRYMFTTDGVKAVDSSVRVSGSIELPAYGRKGVAKMRIAFPIGDVRDVVLAGDTLVINMEPRVVRQDGRANRGVFRVEAVPAPAAAEFIRQFTALRARMP